MNNKTKSSSLIKTGSGLAGLLIVLVILVAINTILGNLRFRADLTDEKLYTLSQGSKNIMTDLDQDVTLKFFFSDSNPEISVFLKEYAKQVEDLLAEYKLAGGGRITIEKYDPEPDSDAEEWAQKYGLSGQPIDMFGSTIYFGLVAVMGNREGAIPALDPRNQNMLEYEITRLIYRVANPEKPVVAVMSSLPVMGTPTPPYTMPGQPPPEQQAPWMIISDLEKDYDLVEISTDADKIDDNASALLLIHPKGLSDQTIFAIDQFVLGGGHLIVFIDPVSLADMETSPQPQNPYGMPEVSSDLSLLLKAWGVSYDARRVVVDYRSASRIRSADNRIEESPVWLSLTSLNMNKDDLLTSQIESVMLPFSGALYDSTTPDVTFTPLITSSDKTATTDARTAQIGGTAIRRGIQEEALPVNMAVRLSGNFKTAFPNGKPQETTLENEDLDEPAEEESDSTPSDSSLKEGNSVVIIFADSDLIYDRFCVEELNFFGQKAYRPMNDNLALLGNAIEQMSGSSDLIGIRSRGRFNRPFDRVLELQEKAVAAWHEQEAALEQKLRDTQQQLRQMEAGKDQSQQAYILSQQQQDAVKQFRMEEVRIKKELKNVRKNLRHDIEQLGVKVKIFNIVLMPVLVSLVGIGYGLYRRKKR